MSMKDDVIEIVEDVLDKRENELQDRAAYVMSDDGSIAIDFSTSAHIQELEKLRSLLISALEREL